MTTYDFDAADDEPEPPKPELPPEYREARARLKQAIADRKAKRR